MGYFGDRMGADIVFTNGRIKTMDPVKPWATAVAVRDGKIKAVGDDLSIKELKTAKSEWIDLQGRSMTPGLVDAHVHFQGFSIFRQKVDLDEAQSLDEVLDRIEKYAATKNRPEPSTPNEHWVEGRGWTQDAWTNPVFPTATHLDRIIPGRPACLRHKSGHAVWVNSKALEIAGVSKTTPDPPGGQIHRDENGNPTGILFEDAMKLVTDLIPKPSINDTALAMKEAQAYCWEVGLTGIHDFDGRSCFQALQLLHSNRDLGLRVVKNIPAKRLEHAIGMGIQSGFGDEWLRIGGIKIFADGALGPRTASMVEPYEGEPLNYGIVVTDKEEMMAYARQASSHNLSLTVHAIGDRANHDILDVYEVVRQEEIGRGQGRTLRHRIEHVQLLHPMDINRLAELNVIASMQPIHATSDMYIAETFWGDRAKLSYAWRTMLDSGAPLVFGSDAPIEKIDPLPGIYAAVSRRRSDGMPGPDGWYPDQKLSLDETIRAFTLAAAETSSQQSDFGSITVGKHADMTIFDRDIFNIPNDELKVVKIAGTVVAGDIKFRAFD